MEKTTTYNGKQVETFDVTPTWEGMLQYNLAVLEDGNAEGKKLVKEELRRMAKAADGLNSWIKETCSQRTMCYGKPMQISPNLIAIRADLQSIVFYANGREIGWHHEHTNTLYWAKNEAAANNYERLLEELKSRSMFAVKLQTASTSYFAQDDVSSRRPFDVKVTMIYPEG